MSNDEPSNTKQKYWNRHVNKNNWKFQRNVSNRSAQFLYIYHKSRVKFPCLHIGGARDQILFSII